MEDVMFPTVHDQPFCPTPSEYRRSSQVELWGHTRLNLPQLNRCTININKTSEISFLYLSQNSTFD